MLGDVILTGEKAQLGLSQRKPINGYPEGDVPTVSFHMPSCDLLPLIWSTWDVEECLRCMHAKYTVALV